MTACMHELRAGRAVLLLNKPYGVLCPFTASGHRPTLADLARPPEVYAAGRLYADSEGLVVLTAHGPLQARLAQPRASTRKTCWVQVEGTPDAERLQRVVACVTLRNGPARAVAARAMNAPVDLWPRDPPLRRRLAIPTAWLELKLAEGRNRQVRRMTAAVGLPTLRLIRWAVGPWTLAGLSSGASRVVRVL